MISTALAHADATLHLHPEALAIAAVCFAVSIAVWRIAAGIRRRRSPAR
jgi:hypothetical protein